MNYISLEKKILTGRNNNQVLPFIVDFDTITPVQFQIVNKNNQLQPIPQGTYYFAGGLKTKTIDSILFLSQDFTITDDIITFNVDTYTSTFLEHITKRNIQIDIQIGVFTDDGSKYVILRDYALACPRIYIDSLPPGDIDLEDYYTKDEVDFILSERIPTKTSQLENDSGFLTSIPDEYITETELNEKGYLTEIPSEYVTETELNQKNYVDETQLEGKGYLTEIPAEYVTETELNEKGYLTEIPTEYVTETELNEKGYLTEIPAEYITETQLNNKGYLTEIPAEYITETELSQELTSKEDVIQYTETTETAITLTKGVYYRNLNAIDSLSLTIDQNSNDSVLLFSTGSTFTVTLNIDTAFKINQDFELAADKTYLIAVDNYTILWSEVQDYTA